MADEEGVLGNLPSSRPGRRSAKRDTASTRPAKAADKAAAKAEATDKPAARTKAATPRPPSTEPTAPEPSGDLVGATIRTAAGVAATGVKVAGAVAQELLRRLPRP